MPSPIKQVGWRILEISAIDCLLLPQAAPPQIVIPIPHPKHRYCGSEVPSARTAEGGGARSIRLPCRQPASPAPHSLL